MKKETIRVIRGIIVIGLGILMAVGGIWILPGPNLWNRESCWYVCLCLIIIAASPFVIAFGESILPYHQSSTSTPSAKPGKFINPWTLAPKVQVKKEEKPIPKIWEKKVLVGG